METNFQDQGTSLGECFEPQHPMNMYEYLQMTFHVTSAWEKPIALRSTNYAPLQAHETLYRSLL